MKAPVLTVRDVLDLPVLQDAQVVAGEAGLNRAVTGVNIIEVPDVWQWLEGGEFLLSAAYPWRNAPDELVELVSKLHGSGISGIGFKLGRYLQALPDRLLAIADELSLPIVLLPPTVAYRDVIEPLYTRLLSAPAAAFDASSKVNQALLRFGLDDQSIEKVAGALARQVQRPVRVVDLLDDAIYLAPPVGVVLRKSIDELEGPAHELVAAVVEQKLRRRVTRVETPEGDALGAALVVARRPHGFVLVLDPPAPETAVEVALAHAAELISFLLLKRLAFLEGRRQASRLFFDSLMSESLSNEEAAEHALTLGIRLTRPCMVLVAGATPSRLSDAGWEAVRRQLERGLAGLPHLVTAVSDEQPLLALVQVTEELQSGFLEHLADDLADVVAGLGERCGLILAAGSPRLGLEGLRRSRSEALIAYETAERTGQAGLVRFLDLGMERVLAQIPPGPLVRDYITSMIGPIEDDPDLLRTLELYLQHGHNKVATAAALPLHRSSLVYRLDKISKLLEIDVDDPERGHELWLAIRLRRILRRAMPSGVAHRD